MKKSQKKKITELQIDKNKIILAEDSKNLKRSSVNPEDATIIENSFGLKHKYS